MLIGYFKPYRDLTGTISKTDGKYHGRVLIPKNYINYIADTFEELEVEFHKAVDSFYENMSGEEISYLGPYKDLTGTISYTDGKYHGRLSISKNDIDYEANTLEELEVKFRKVVDIYWEGCIKRGEVQG